MIEYTIAEAIATGCSLTLSVDIWACEMPVDQKTGVCVTVLNDELMRSGVLGEAILAIDVIRENAYDARVLATSIATLLNTQEGLDGWVTIGDGASISNKGVDAENYHLFTVYVNIRKE